MFTICDQLRAIDSLQRLREEDVAGCRDEFDVARFGPQDRNRLVDLALRQRRDDDARGMQLANGFASDLHTHHAGAAEDQEGARRGGLYTRSSSPFGRSQRSVMRSCVSQRSQSSAAMQPVPAAVTA